MEILTALVAAGHSLGDILIVGGTLLVAVGIIGMALESTRE